MDSVMTAVTEGLTSLKGDVLTMLGGVVTIGIAIFGIKFATSQGLGFFKKVTK